MEIADNAVRIWELLRAHPGSDWDKARDMLELTDDEMREAVDLLNEVLEFKHHDDRVAV